MSQNVAFERKSANTKRLEKDEKELQELLESQNQTVEAEKEEEVETTKKEEAPAEKEELSGEEKSFKKRYGDLRKHVEKIKADYEARISALEKSGDNIVPPKSEEDIQEWIKKYPDVAGVVETIARKKAEQLVEGFEQKFKQYDQMQEEVSRRAAENKIRESHSDFDSLKSSDDFHNWAEEQPKWVQDALYENENDPASVVRVIDLYKVDKGMTPSARKGKAKEAAASVKSGSRIDMDATEASRKIRESEVAKMSDKEYEKNEEKILEAMRTGNFIYDRSGAAR